MYQQPVPDNRAFPFAYRIITGMGSSSCGLEWKLGYCRNGLRMGLMAWEGRGEDREEMEEVVTKSQVGSGRGLHDRAGDEGVRLAWSPVITFCPISALLRAFPPAIHPLTYHHPRRTRLFLSRPLFLSFSSTSSRKRRADFSGQHLSTLLPCNYWPPNEEGCGDATFENLLLEITAPQRAYVFRAPWQIGICAQTRVEILEMNRPRILDFIERTNMILLRCINWEITFICFDISNFWMKLLQVLENLYRYFWISYTFQNDEFTILYYNILLSIL